MAKSNFLVIYGTKCRAVRYRVSNVAKRLLSEPSSILAKELCTNLLIYDPMDRATAQTALKHVWFTAELLDLELAYRSRVGAE